MSQINKPLLENLKCGDSVFVEGGFNKMACVKKVDIVYPVTGNFKIGNTRFNSYGEELGSPMYPFRVSPIDNENLKIAEMHKKRYAIQKICKNIINKIESNNIDYKQCSDILDRIQIFNDL